MDHITAERLEQLTLLTAGGNFDAAETDGLLSAEELAHVEECPQCIDAFGDAIRDGVKRANSARILNMEFKVKERCHFPAAPPTLRRVLDKNR